MRTGLLLAAWCGVLPLTAQYTVTTVAGGAIPSGIPAENSLAYNNGITGDAAGNIYLCGAGASGGIHRIRPDGIIEAFAGTSAPGFSGDGGPALQAQINFPTDCKMDAQGGLLFWDQENFRVRRVDTSGKISTFAFTGVPGLAGDGGPATQAQGGGFLATDASGNVYVSQGNVRVIGPDGVIHRFAGSDNPRTAPGNGDGGPAIDAFLNATSVATDAAGNVYVLDGFGLGGPSTIRRIGKDGIITTVVGLASSSALPPDDGVPATSAYLNTVGFTADPAGNLYFGDGSYLWRVDAKSGLLQKIAGNSNFLAPSEGPAFSAYAAWGPYLYMDGTGALWFGALEKLANGAITLAAARTPQDAPDGIAATSAWLVVPQSIAVSSSGDLYIGESATCAIRKVGSDGLLTTVAGTGNCKQPPGFPGSIAVDSKGTLYVSPAELTVGATVYALSNGVATVLAGFKGGTLAVDSADRLYEFEGNAGAGGNGVMRATPGSAPQQVIGQVYFPNGQQARQMAMAIDSQNNLYLAVSSIIGALSSSIYRVSPTGAGSFLPDQYGWPVYSMAVDGLGNFWVNSSGALTATGTGFSYQSTFGGASNGPLLETQLGGVVAAGPNNTIYVLNSGDLAVKKISGAPPATAPQITAAGMVNAATLQGGAIAPGELLSIFGSNFGSPSVKAFTTNNNFVPSVLGDIQVLIGGGPASITAVSNGQINVFAPYYLAGLQNTTVQVNAHGATSNTVTVPVAKSAFGLFTADASGSGEGAILNQDGSVNGPGNAAAAGQVVSLFGTGEGGVTPPLGSGYLEITPPFSMFALPVSATVGGQPAAVAYGGLAPFLPSGVDQVNVTIPAGTGAGQAAVAVTVGGVASTQKVTVWVK